MKAFYTVEGAIRWISRMLNYLGTGALAVMMLLTVADVAGRYIFGVPVRGSIELSEYFMVFVGCLGLGWCTLNDGQAKVDLVVQKFSSRVRGVFGVITHLFSLIIFSLIAWQGLMEANIILKAKETSDVLEIPFFPFYLVLALGFFMLCLTIVMVLIQQINKVVKT